MLPIVMPRIHDVIFMEIDSGLKEIIIFGVKPPIRGAYNNPKKMKFWESALFSG